jgi:hypothetical protein
MYEECYCINKQSRGWLKRKSPMQEKGVGDNHPETAILMASSVDRTGQIITLGQLFQEVFPVIENYPPEGRE